MWCFQWIRGHEIKQLNWTELAQHWILGLCYMFGHSHFYLTSLTVLLVAHQFEREQRRNEKFSKPYLGTGLQRQSKGTKPIRQRTNAFCLKSISKTFWLLKKVMIVSFSRCLFMCFVLALCLKLNFFFYYGFERREIFRNRNIWVTRLTTILSDVSN